MNSVNEKFKNVKPRIWSDEYIYMMEQQKEVFKKIYEAMALAEDGTILFQCSAGKVRNRYAVAFLSVSKDPFSTKQSNF